MICKKVWVTRGTRTQRKNASNTHICHDKYMQRKNAKEECKQRKYKQDSYRTICMDKSIKLQYKHPAET